MPSSGKPVRGSGIEEGGEPRPLELSTKMLSSKMVAEPVFTKARVKGSERVAPVKLTVSVWLMSEPGESKAGGRSSR